jgi:DNA transposition AAA+ family ATPase
VIARVLRINGSKANTRLLDDIVAGLDPNKLLIVDEVHKFFTTYPSNSGIRCIETLRYIKDQSGCGMVLAGTRVWRDEIEEGQFRKVLVQMRRRGLYETDLKSCLPYGDLEMVAAEFGLEMPTGEALDVFMRMAEQDGLGMLLTRLTDARVVAAKRKQKVGWDHFLDAHALVLRMKMREVKKGVGR